MKSHRQIFRSSAIIGGASVINILLGIIRVKVLAVLLGPAGVGVMGLYQSILSTASMLAGGGLGSSGVRQIAATQDDEKSQAMVCRALFWLSFLLGLLGTLALWMMREEIALLVFEDRVYTADVGWLGLGVFLSVIAASLTALLQGLRRIGDMARVNVLSAVVATMVGISSVLWLGHDGVFLLVLATPAASVGFAIWYTARLARRNVMNDWPVLIQQSRAMIALGIPLMAAGLLTLLSQLVARTLIIQDLGLDASGYFQAAWAISMTYISFVLAAMGADYLPRLTEVIRDRERAIRVVNEQTEMALLLAGPVLLAMMTLAPLVIELLYAKSFAPAAEILRWQVFGDILKVMGWSMGFIVLAQGRGGIFVVTQLNWNVVYLICLWFGMETIGLLATGVGFFIAYVIQVGLVRIVTGKLIGFSTTSRNLWLFMALLVAAGIIQVVSGYGLNTSYFIGMILTLWMSTYSVWRLNQLIDLTRWVSEVIGRFKKS